MPRQVIRRKHTQANIIMHLGPFKFTIGGTQDVGPSTPASQVNNNLPEIKTSKENIRPFPRPDIAPFPFPEEGNPR